MYKYNAFGMKHVSTKSRVIFPALATDFMQI